MNNFVHNASDVAAIDEVFQLQGADPEANISIRFLDELHAKIYATNWCGIVGSANLTRSGFEGGNIEAAMITKDVNEVSQVNQEFNKAWNRSTTLSKKDWENQKKKIETLLAECQSLLEQIDQAMRKVRVVLTRIPDGGKGANYYSNLVECLSTMALNNSNSSCTRTQLIRQLQAGHNNQFSQKGIESRIEFIQELGLIKQHNTRYRVTPVGVRLDKKYDFQWEFFKLLFRWCEENGDHQLRILLTAVDKIMTDSSSKVSLKELRKAIPASTRIDYWESRVNNGMTDETAYIQFRTNSCHARNWLKSMGILKEHKQKGIKYTLGDIYIFYLLPEKRKGVSLNERLNEIILGIDD